MMRKIFFLLILIIFLCECKKDDTQNNAQDNAHWTTLVVNSSNLISVYFTDADTGYVVGSAYHYGVSPLISADLFKTMNGGTSWTALTLPNLTDLGLNSVYFTNANTGYAVGYDFNQDLERSGVIVKTIDGGMTWTALTLPIKMDGFFLFSVYFTDANTGYAVGSLTKDSLGVILQTINGGTTWTALTISNEIVDGLISVYFVDSNTGYALGSKYKEGYYSVILKTINGGTSWTALPIGITGLFNSVYFTDDNIGYTVGKDGTNMSRGIIIKTIDGGTSWKALLLPILPYTYFLNSVYFTDDNTGYAVGQDGTNHGIIIKTIDGGTSWKALLLPVLPYTYLLNSVYFTNANTGYAVGGNGIILKTTTAGE